MIAWLHINCSPGFRAVNPDFCAHPMGELVITDTVAYLIFSVELLYSEFSKFVMSS